MDIVYTHKPDPRSGNNELIYSLRSVERYLSGYDNIYVIGHDPELRGLIYIPATDLKSAAINIKDKLLIACNHHDISEDFLYIADDHYFLREQSAPEFPVYSNGTLENLARTQSNSYKQLVIETLKLVPGGKNYNVHAPIIYNKAKLKEVIETTDWQPLGFLIKSLYCNRFELQSVEMADCKISRDISITEMKSRIANSPFFSTGRESSQPNLKQFMDELFPDKSKYE